MRSVKLLGAIGFVLLLPGCGVDGPPEPPPPKGQSATGASVTLSGEAKAGVVGRS